jgi:hypothetical protein
MLEPDKDMDALFFLNDDNRSPVLELCLDS